MISKNDLLNKLFIAFALFFIVRGISYTETHFSGFTGIKGDFFSEHGKDTFTPNLTIDAFFAGQLDFGKNVFLRGELSVATEDILNDDIFDGAKSDFALNELSLTFRKSIYKTSNYLSFFMGTYEPIGSDVFLMRHFGIEPFSSELTRGWLGLNGSYVFPFYGMGGSYVLRLEEIPMAFGLYIYHNDKNPDEVSQLNFDLRYAIVWSNFTLDCAAGLGIPLENKRKTGEDAILVIDAVYLHFGWNFFMGNNYSPMSLLFQGGFANLPLHTSSGKNELEAKDVYVIVEPRFQGKKLKMHITGYSLPETTIKTMMLIDDTFGLDMNLFTDKIALDEKNLKFGIHALMSFEGLNFMDMGKIPDSFKDETYTLKIAPYFGIPIMGGDLNLMLQANISNIIFGNGAEWLKFSAGYKRQI